MLKIYNAVGVNGKVVLKRGIKFDHGRYNTGHDGYGTIVSARGDCKSADYLIEDLEYFKDRVRKVEKKDGWIRNNSFILYSPYSALELEERQESGELPWTGLDEEAVLLFTDYVTIGYDKNKYNIRKMFGRFPEYGAFILLPGAEFDMSFPAYYEESVADYEVVRSMNKPKQLYLTKADRKIYTGE